VFTFYGYFDNILFSTLSLACVYFHTFIPSLISLGKYMFLFTTIR